MKIHPRERIVSQAKAQMADAIQTVVQQHDLTFGELTALLASELSSVAKYQIRHERHPDDPDKPGGLA